jgi:hypothetical protein
MTEKGGARVLVLASSAMKECEQNAANDGLDGAFSVAPYTAALKRAVRINRSVFKPRLRFLAVKG